MKRFDPAWTLGARAALQRLRPHIIPAHDKARAHTVTRLFAWVLLLFFALCLGGSMAAAVHRSVF